MNHRLLASTIPAAVAMLLVLTPRPAVGQSPAPFNPPRTADGQPDIQGYFGPNAPNAAHSLEEGEDPVNTIGRGQRTEAQLAEALKNRKVLIVDPAPGPKIPYQPWARQKQRELLDAVFAPLKVVDIEPEDRCALLGVPRSNDRGDVQFIQSPGMVTILYAWNHAHREIPLDGRPHLPASIKMHNGDSRGHWEGNTLVVDVTNFNDLTWFDAHGTLHTDALHVVERYTVVDANTINYRATLDDPKAFTRPWSVAWSFERVRQRNYEMFEEACVEGNGESVQGMVDVGRDLVKRGIKGRHEHTPGFYDEK